MKKLSIKILSSMIAISSIASLSGSLVACHKNSTPEKNTWDDFKALAKQETAPSLKAIINHNDLNLYHWKTNDIAIFSAGGVITPSEKAETLSATIIIANPSAPDLKWPINLKISYNKGEVYTINNWSWSQDHSINSWDSFKNKAMGQSASDLLALIKPWNDTKKYLWTYGVQSQITWSKTDQAEFDTFGNLTTQDKYLGMQGKPKVDNIKEHTITAIISKKGKNGAYDSDPIKATATYTIDRAYQNSDWVFSKDIQLQSLAMIQKNYNDEIALIKANFDNFGKNNWVTYSVNPTNNQNQRAIQHSILFDESLNDAGYDYHSDNAFDESFNFSNIANGLQSKIIINFQYKNAIHQLSLYFDYTFFNKEDINDGLSTFNYTWSGIVD